MSNNADSKGQGEKILENYKKQLADAMARKLV
jgi:hypothetical protein